MATHQIPHFVFIGLLSRICISSESLITSDIGVPPSCNYKKLVVTSIQESATSALRSISQLWEPGLGNTFHRCTLLAPIGYQLSHVLASEQGRLRRALGTHNAVQRAVPRRSSHNTLIRTLSSSPCAKKSTVSVRLIAQKIVSYVSRVHWIFRVQGKRR